MANEVSAGAVIFRREGNSIRYLLLQYAAGHWDYVKGHIEKGEDEKATIIRECREETGINDLEFAPDFRETIHYFFRRGKETVSKDVQFYLAETKTKNVRISSEHIGYEWLDFDNALKTVTFKNAKEILKKAQKHLAKI